ncbi:MAG: hypothetical protein FJ004_04115 [Chloroflexi bacterium]|nr:hypothetical protein [Chloroflexota bacterium]
MIQKIERIARNEKKQIVWGIVKCNFTPSHDQAFSNLAPGLEWQRMCKHSFEWLRDDKGRIKRDAHGKRIMTFPVEYNYWIPVPKGIMGRIECQRRLEEFRNGDQNKATA